MICLLHEHKVISKIEIVSSANCHYITFVSDWRNYVQMIDKIIIFSNDSCVQLSET